MKKLITLLSIGVMLSSCDWTSVSEDTQKLQSKYSTVYPIDRYRYICIDSIHTYDVSVNLNGTIKSVVKIK